eukprot:SAG22_NODE_2179_length_2878_cov_1.678661_1_plen_193_part_00
MHSNGDILAIAFGNKPLFRIAYWYTLARTIYDIGRPSHAWVKFQAIRPSSWNHHNSNTLGRSPRMRANHLRGTVLGFVIRRSRTVRTVPVCSVQYYRYCTGTVLVTVLSTCMAVPVLYLRVDPYLIVLFRCVHVLRTRRVAGPTGTVVVRTVDTYVNLATYYMYSCNLENLVPVPRYGCHSVPVRWYSVLHI